jgi:hypothetical protein
MASTTSSDRYSRIERRTIAGQEARIGTEPDELRVEWRPGRAVYHRVRVGDLLKDADADVSSPRIDEWRVTEITPARVVGEDTGTGAVREWDRETLERGLVIGNYATNLTDFELVTAYPVGSWDDYGTDEGDEYAYHGRPYLTVVAYGDNGQKYGRRYRFVEDGNATDVKLWEEDTKTGRIGEALRTRLDEVIGTALESDGYRVR